MAKSIENTALGYNVGFAADQFFAGAALADTGAITSEEFLFDQTLGNTQLIIVADGAVSTGAGETLVVSVTKASASGGTFAEVASITIPASTSFADGDIIAAYASPSTSKDCYTKVAITSDFDASGFDVIGAVVSL